MNPCPIPVLNSVAETYRQIRANWRVLIVALPVPASFTSLIETTGQYFPNDWRHNLAFWAAAAPFYVMFAVICHRTVILGGSALPNRIGLFWSLRETRFLGWTIALIVLNWLLAFAATILAALMPFGLLDFDGAYTAFFIGALFAALIVGYFHARLSMLFPATAVGERTSITESWSRTEGNGIRIMGIVLLSSAPILLAFLGITRVPGFRTELGFEVVSEVFYHLMAGVTVCAISVTYRRLESRSDDLFSG